MSSDIGIIGLAVMGENLVRRSFFLPSCLRWR